MSLDEWVHVHYEPKEYSVGLRIFKETMPFEKKVLDHWFHLAEHDADMKPYAEKQFKLYLEANKEKIGDTLYSMYANMYSCVKSIY